MRLAPLTLSLGIALALTTVTAIAAQPGTGKAQIGSFGVDLAVRDTAVKPAPVIDGLTGDQRFFLSWAQVWKSKYRDESLLTLIKTNPHSPVMYRANGPLRNFDPLYQAFDVKPGDAMYLPPEQRVRIW